MEEDPVDTGHFGHRSNFNRLFDLRAVRITGVVMRLLESREPYAAVHLSDVPNRPFR